MTKYEKNARTLHLVQNALGFAKIAIQNASSHMGHTTTDVEDSPQYKELLGAIDSLGVLIEEVGVRVSKLKDSADGY